MSTSILIVYYSWSENTDRIARLIQTHTGGELLRIVPVRAYPARYQECTRQAKQEIRFGFRPQITGHIDTGGFDTLFIGSPNWWSTLAPPVVTYLSENDLSGKQVIPFCSHGGGGKGHLFEDIVPYCPDSRVREGLSLYEDGHPHADTEISAWLKDLGVLCQAPPS